MAAIAFNYRHEISGLRGTASQSFRIAYGRDSRPEKITFATELPPIHGRDDTASFRERTVTAPSPALLAAADSLLGTLNLSGGVASIARRDSHTGETSFSWRTAAGQTGSGASLPPSLVPVASAAALVLKTAN